MSKIKLLMNKKYFRNLLFSYVIILVVLLILSITVYSIVFNIAFNEHKTYMSNVLKTSKVEMDSKLLVAENVANQISTSNEVLDYADNSRKNFSYDDLQSIQYLKNAAALNKDIENIYLYKEGENRIVSSSTSTFLEDYFISMHKTDGYDFKQWYDFLNDKTYTKKIVSLPRADIPAGKRGDFIAYVQHLNVGRTKTGMTIVVLFDADNISKLMLGQGDERGEQFLIVDKSGKILVSRGNVINEGGIEKYVPDKDNASLTTRIDGKKVVISSLKSSTASWKYIIVSDYNMYYSKMHTVAWIMFALILLFIIMGVIVLFFSVKRNYKPVDQLMSSMSKINGIENDNSEFEFINDTLHDIYSKNKEFEKINRNNSDRLREEYLRNLIEGIITDHKVSDEEEMLKYGIKLISDTFVIVEININGKVGNDETGMNLDLMAFAVNNVANELFRQKEILYYSVRMRSDAMFVILNFPDDYNNGKIRNTIISVCGDVGEFFIKNYDQMLDFSVSTAEQSTESLPDCYKQSVQAMDYKFVCGKGRVIFYDDIRNKRTSCIYDNELINILTKNIQAGKYEQSKDIIDKLFEDIIYSEKYSLISVRSFVFELTHAVDCAMANQYSFDTEELINSTAAEIQEHLLKTISDYCSYVSKKGDVLISEKIIKYIEDNYSNIDLSINMIGEAFDMAPSYVSRLFREQTQVSLLNYLHKYRVNKSKDLLHGKMSLNSVALQVGYVSANSYNRVFKKFEGITPGQYRREMNKSAQN